MAPEQSESVCPSGGIHHDTHWYCPDCDWVHPEASAHRTDEQIEELLQRIEQRRRDPEFMERLRGLVDDNRDVLDRLAKERSS